MCLWCDMGRLAERFADLARAAHGTSPHAKVSEPAVDDPCVIWDDGMIQGCAGNWLRKAIEQNGSARLDDAIAEEWQHAVRHDIDAVVERVNYALQHGPGSEWASAYLGGEGNYLVLVPKVSEPAGMDVSTWCQKRIDAARSLCVTHPAHGALVKYERAVAADRLEGRKARLGRLASGDHDTHNFDGEPLNLTGENKARIEHTAKQELCSIMMKEYGIQSEGHQISDLKAELSNAEARVVAACAALNRAADASKCEITELKKRLNEAVCTSQGALTDELEHLKDRLEDAETELTAEHDRAVALESRLVAALPKRPVEPTALSTVSLSEDPDVRLYDQSHELAMLKTSNEHALAIRAVPMQVKSVYIGLGALLTMTLAQLSPLLN